MRIILCVRLEKKYDKKYIMLRRTQVGRGRVGAIKRQTACTLYTNRKGCRLVGVAVLYIHFFFFFFDLPCPRNTSPPNVSKYDFGSYACLRDRCRGKPG